MSGVDNKNTSNATHNHPNASKGENTANNSGKPNGTWIDKSSKKA